MNKELAEKTKALINEQKQLNERLEKIDKDLKIYKNYIYRDTLKIWNSRP